VWFALQGDASWAIAGAQLAALNIVMLFFGQRLAKDYAGAASLVPYFILSAGAGPRLRACRLRSPPRPRRRRGDHMGHALRAVAGPWAFLCWGRLL
jgi:hypothetical protein